MLKLMPPILLICLSLWAIACTGASSPNSETNDNALEAPTGHLLVVNQGSPPEHKIVSIDVATEAVETLFTAPEFTQIYQLDVSADGQQLVFAYTPPPTIDTGFFDRSMLYQLDLNQPNAEPQLLLGGSTPQEFYLQPTLSPDGQHLYYVKIVQDFNAAVANYLVAMERYDLQSGEILPLATDGIWPRLSRDGSKLTYIGVNPVTQERGLFLAEPNGTQVQTLVPVGLFFDIDTPLFSPDGAWVYFSVAKDAPGVSWLGRLLRVEVAQAHADHNVPSDWWRAPVAGGEPEQVTEREEIIIYGEFSPDGNHLAYSTATSLYLMTVADNSLRQISNRSLAAGVLAWIE